MDYKNLRDNFSALTKSKNACKYTDLDDGVIEVNCITQRGNLNILHLNIRSFVKNCDNLLILLNELQEKGVVVHVIGLCETFLNENSCSITKLDNYQCVNKYRDTKLGGGTTILIHNSVKFLHLLDSPFNENFESICVELLFQGRILSFAEFYRPPNTNE